MRTLPTRTRTLRILTVLGGTAAALSLSACGLSISFDGDEKREETPTAEQPADEQPTKHAPTAAPAEDPAASPAPGGTDPQAGPSDDADSGTGTGEVGFELDENGTGTIPASMIEDGIRDSAAEQGVTFEEIECTNDMHVWNETGSSSCNVVHDGRTYYGVAKVTSVSGQTVQWELDFPGLEG